MYVTRRNPDWDSPTAIRRRILRSCSAPIVPVLTFQTETDTDRIRLWEVAGTALGGIRTPWVDAPVTSHPGEGQAGNSLCILFGTSSAFDGVTLDQLYPTHLNYKKAFRKATREAVRNRHIRGRDARLMKKAAKASGIGD